MEDLVEPLVFYVVFLFSTTLHEAAHAWAAMRGGDLTAYAGGQVSIDPVPHIRREPFGMVVLPILGIVLSGWPFGYASAPYDPDWARRHPRRAAWMALAGPAANLGLILLAAATIRGGVLMGAFYAPSSVHFSQVTAAGELGVTSAAAFILSVFFSMNLVLVVLNLIPLPPLDGSGALPLLLPEPLVERYQEFIRQPMLGWIGILLAFYLIRFLYDPIFLLAVNLLYPEAGYA
jgi:Zn-dependent protease